VPRILSGNSGQSATDGISELYAAHAAGQTGAGVNVEDSGERGHTVDAAAAGIVDALATKLSALRLACDAAITVLRVDTIIMSKQVRGVGAAAGEGGGPAGPAPCGERGVDSWDWQVG
jgi:T-complex protein 1 subunit theta